MFDLTKQWHSVHWDINPPQKHHPLFLAKPPSLSLQTVKAPLLRQPLHPPCHFLYIAFHEPLLKIGFSVNVQNIKGSYPFSPFHLKVVKFLFKSSEFEFLVMNLVINFFVTKYFRF